MTTAILALITAQNPPGAPAAAKELLASFSQNLHAQTVHPFDQNRTIWNFVPIARNGAHLSDLDPAQTKLAEQLLKASLSDLGYNRVKNIKILETVLREIENNPSRDPGQYVFTFFGQPDATQPWAWRYEGHHISLNFTYLGDKLVASTPQFFGANPAHVSDGPHKGLRALAPEEDLAYAFLNTLNPDQLQKAVVDPKAPADILTSNARKAAIQKDSGISIKDLSKPQRLALMALLHIHAESQTKQESKRRLEKIDEESIVFAWMGETEPGKPHYYRIQGNSFLVELDNTQNNANHIHTVWRDFRGDFGEDDLADHYKNHHHTH